ncbi:hypothetical protein G7Y89_g5142 [Cudoniella acicularis]|uniref:Heterokaryon incompatibility domain-containing protein n=1 Tax=Cudoniella acicularis TaxID=354080 RepID=A0A8H4RR72_9HELO|nr:hypothetical protein G7Y89_g5142 [Cudoniella acicularis]
MPVNIIEGKGEKELCDICQTIDLQQYLFQNLCPGAITLGPFQNILKKSNCPLCRLIIQALNVNSADYWEKRKYPAEACYFGQQDGLSRPSVLEVWFDSTSETLPDGTFGHSTTLGEILLVSDDNKMSGRRPTNRGVLHGEKCQKSKSKPPSQGSYPLILIDVERRRLVNADLDCRYVALSYVWGKVYMLQTLEANLVELQEDNALANSNDKIPRAIREAMEVVAGMGEKYLWVDALCIVQDAPDKLSHISCMDEIYSRAVLTIVALASNDASAGLPGICPDSRNISQGYGNIDDAQTYFRRGFSVCSEDILHEYSAASPFVSSATDPFEIDIWTTDVSNESKFGKYQSLVMSYCKRELSYQCDILDAFAGIISVLKGRFGMRFLSALPEEALYLALLWRPQARLRPRFSQMENNPESVSAIFPSWCWTAWVGDIYWNPLRTGAYAGNHIYLKSELKAPKVKDALGLRSVQRNTDAIFRSIRLSPPLYSFTEEEKIVENGLLLENTIPESPILYFWAQAVRLDMLSLSSKKKHSKDDNHQLSSKFRDLFGKAWIYDKKGWHCGKFTGLQSWPPGPTHDVSNFELLLLSYFYQEVVTDQGIQANINRLSEDFRSSYEYYAEIFNPNHFAIRED